MAVKTQCSVVMDILDSADSGNLAGMEESVREHLRECRACLSYAAVTRSLITGLVNDKEVDLRNKFNIRMEKPVHKNRVLQAAGWAALAAGVIVMMVGLLTVPGQRFTVNQSNVVASNSTENVPQVQYDYESAGLDYYYEISFKM